MSFRTGGGARSGDTPAHVVLTGYTTEKLQEVRRVVLFSDSQCTVGLGNGNNYPSTNQELWLAYRHFRDVDYDLKFYWEDRNFHPLHVLVNQLSKAGELMRDLASSADPYGYD